MTQIKSYIPKIRFPGFVGDWEEKKLWEIANKVNDKNKTNEENFVLTNSATQWVVSQNEYFDKDIANQNNLENYYIVSKNDFVYNPRISKYAPVWPIKLNKLKKWVMSPLYTIFRTSSSNVNISYIEKYFNSTHWYKYMKWIANYWARHDRMNITTQDFFNMPITLPSIQEQQKIASFLLSVDEKIEKIKEKKKNLEDYKKWISQKIFSQEIRFKDKNWKEFGEWEEKKLGDIWELKNWYSFKSITYNNKWFYNVITISNVKWNKYININEKTNKILEIPTDIQNHQILKENDILISLTWNVWRVSLNIWNNNVLNQRVWLFLTNKYIDKKYLYSLLSNWYFENEMILRWQWAAQFNIWKWDIENYKINLPMFPEQQKIASFLSSIDEKIENVDIEIKKMEKFKKGLLQNMFV